MDILIDPRYQQFDVQHEGGTYRLTVRIETRKLIDIEFKRADRPDCYVAFGPHSVTGQRIAAREHLTT